MTALPLLIRIAPPVAVGRSTPWVRVRLLTVVTLAFEVRIRLCPLASMVKPSPSMVSGWLAFR